MRPPLARTVKPTVRVSGTYAVAPRSIRRYSLVLKPGSVVSTLGRITYPFRGLAIRSSRP